MTNDFGPPCPPCRVPEACACEWGIAFQQKNEASIVRYAAAKSARCRRCGHPVRVHMGAGLLLNDTGCQREGCDCLLSAPEARQANERVRRSA